MFDPSVGRWTTPDPIGFADDINPYRYVKNNPTNATDPTGLAERIIVGYHSVGGGKYTVQLPDGSQENISVPAGQSLQRIMELRYGARYPGAVFVDVKNPGMAVQQQQKQIDTVRETQAKNREAYRQFLSSTVIPKGKEVESLKDMAGPDVTDWFARDLLAHIKYRKATLAKYEMEMDSAARGAGMAEGAAGAVSGVQVKQGLEDTVPYEPFIRDPGYMYQVKYLDGPKWMKFGSPSEGRGPNTVVVEGQVLRKNQLGNIELGMITGLMPPIGLNCDLALGAAYKAVAPTYKPTHPHSSRFGDFIGLNRADNLAAFGVGVRIAERVNELPSWKSGKDPTLEEIKQIVKEVFTKEELSKAVARYSYLYQDGKTQIQLDALFTIEYYGGLNTNGLDTSKSDPFKEKMTSIDHFKNVLYPGYQQYKKEREARGEKPLHIDDWLQENHERYWLP